MSMSNSMSGSEIKEARERRQMSQQDLADLVGVSLRTVGSWERGESVPRSRMGALHAALGSNWEAGEDNRRELGRLIREQLDLNGWTVSDAARRAGEMTRTFHNWADGVNRPLRKVHAKVEEVLGWEPGSIQRILGAPITAIPSLADVRDWSRVEGGNPVQIRVSQIPTSELVLELGSRVAFLQHQVEELEAELSEVRGSGVVSTPAQVGAQDSNVRHLYGLAAHNTDAGRNTEHLEGNEE